MPKAKITIGYKVVSQRPEGLVSAYLCKLSGEWREKYCLEYKPGVIRRPIVKGTRLFAFEDLIDAKRYAAVSSYSVIYKAELHNAHRNGWLLDFMEPPDEDLKSMGFSLYLSLSRSELVKWFKLGKTEGNSDFPSSVCCTAIKLLEEVK